MLKRVSAVPHVAEESIAADVAENVESAPGSLADHPIADVRWVPIDKVEANDYNPNVVARNELRLLYLSIKQDGYTQPVVTVYDKERDKYVVVDGFHRTLVMRYHEDIRASTGGLLPVVVIDKSINDRMASTIRHNRARGKHNVAGMANIVFEMLHNGWTDEEVCAEMGMEADELIRLKYVTGFSKLFEDVEYGRSWQTRRMIRIKRDYAAGEQNDNG